MGFDPAFAIARLRPASYNPRAIAADALEQLRASLRTIGFAKPIIATRDGLLVAGHQRTRAARAEGLETVPAFVLDEINDADEIRFNQLHNGTDLDDIDRTVRVPPGETGVFEDVSPDAILGDERAAGATVRSEISKLVMHYGLWGCAVATASGVVLSSPQYAIVCKTLRLPCRVYRVPNDQEAAARTFFGRTYGEFSYAHLPKHTWIQTWAQPMRLRQHAREVDVSVMYESDIIPELKRGERLIDFGCGQADYVRMLQRIGHRAYGVEFFHRDGGDIDTGAVHRMIASALDDWAAHGGFDVVVLDSVITSVDTVQAESDVMTCVNALAKPGARVYVAGRRRERVDDLRRATKLVEKAPRRYLEFFDKDGFSGLFRKGEWFYQKFHTEPEARALVARFLGDAPQRLGKTSGYWRISTRKTKELPPEQVEAALRREFDLPWPGGRSVGRADQAVAAWRAAIRLAHGA